MYVSRFLILCLDFLIPRTLNPASKFGWIEVFDGSTNVTLQAVARIIVQSLNDFSDNGLSIPGVADGPVTW